MIILQLGHNIISREAVSQCVQDSVTTCMQPFVLFASIRGIHAVGMRVFRAVGSK